MHPLTRRASRRFSTGVVAAFLVVLAVPALAPAQAISVAPRLTAVGKAYIAVGDSNGSQMVLACEAQGSDAFASVGITVCETTNGLTAAPLTLPGLTAATANTGRALPGTYQVCVAAVGRTILGSREVTAPLRCESSVLGVGVASTTA